MRDAIIQAGQPNTKRTGRGHRTRWEYSEPVRIRCNVCNWTSVQRFRAVMPAYRALDRHEASRDHRWNLRGMTGLAAEDVIS